ncbi:MAG: DUF4124 domain-containing protein [Thiohalomonadaceae bacterium]
MNRVIARILLGTLFLAVAVPFVLPLKQGKPLLDYRQLSLPGLPDIPRMDTDSAPPSAVTVYRWRGTHGEWHFGNVPPAQDIPVEVVRIDPDANTFQGHSAVPARVPPVTVPGAYSAERIQQAFSQTREAQALMNSRAAEQEAVLQAR